MASIVHRLHKQGLLTPPRWLPDNVMYETIMGSVAYGVSDDMPDCDVYGFCMPEKNMLFPHLQGQILGFGRQIQRFEQYQEHHVYETGSQREYDLAIFSIVKYFQLCMENNPNMIDSLFTPVRCVLHSTRISEMLREKRRMFLHKGCWGKFKGYAYAQMHKMDGKSNAKNPKRAESIARIGYDVKFAYHIVRLLCEVEQIMVEGDLDLERNREQLKSIRRGEWTIDQIKTYFTDKEKTLEQTYAECKLPHGPDETAIKNLLVQCIEEHYGSLDKALVVPGKYDNLITELDTVLDRYR